MALGILWIEHHGMMSAVHSIDRRFLERTLAFYRRRAGAEVIGQLRIGEDPRGFLITYVRLGAGPTILEVFSFDSAMRPNPWQPHRTPPGLLRIALSARGTEDASSPGGDVVLDPDGTPVEIVRGPEPPVGASTPPPRAGR